MSYRVTLSDAFLSAVGVKPVYDSEVPQLFAILKKRNGVTFCVYAKVSGKIFKRVIGVYPEVSIHAARRIARELLAQAKVELEPAPQPVGMTISKLYDEYFTSYVVHRCRSSEAIAGNFRRYFGEISNARVDELTPFDVQKWHNKLVTKHGGPTANRSLQLLRTLYNFGDKWQLIQCRNPARAVVKFPEQPRERFVQDEEMPILLSAIERLAPPKLKEIFKLCLFTSGRIQNVCSMRWADINWNSLTWTIEGGKTKKAAYRHKTNATHVIPLVPEAVEILRAQFARRVDNCEWVFPARCGSRGHISNPYDAWHRVISAAGIADLRPHDLRRTHATTQAANGNNIVVIARTLGHKDLKSTSIYTKCSLDTVRLAMAGAVTSMLSKGAEATL